ncbi:alpha/beta hydrolase [Chitinophaga sp.]|uniref:alpha/beta hydrolase n=1 Tax=Chitinophaga sp. TaxID=1869181 RepID=UPI002635890E|nr:alpha/beta hydrolase [uncultured Chitinophaga sp.]
MSHKNDKAAGYSADPHLTPEVRKFLDILNAPGSVPVESLPVPEARQVLTTAQQSFKTDVSGVTVTEKTITAGDFTLLLHIVKPEGAAPLLPGFLFIHGGGWVLGDFPTHQRLVRDLVVHSGAAAVFVNYTPTPNQHYPRAIDEIFAATQWLAENGREIGVDGNNIAIVGNSVGGNMSAVTAIRCNEKGGPKLKCQVLMWPVTNADFETKSWRRYGEQRFLTASLMKWMWSLYTTKDSQRDEPYASPLQAAPEQLKGLPPTLIQVAENDILRSEGEAYGRKLSEAGVQATTIRYLGVIHDWGLLNGLAHLPETRSLVLHAAAELKFHLGR